VYLILLRSLLVIVVVVGAVIAWYVASPWLSATLDHFFTVEPEPQPIGDYELAPERFTFGRHTWSLIGWDRNWRDIHPTTLRLAYDSQGRMTLGSDGHAFTFGPIHAYYDAVPRDTYYDFDPDPGDQISFTKTHGWLPWPIPPRVNFMGGALPTWNRYAYYDLLWKKTSGAQLRMIWRDRQSYWSGTGWTDDNLPVIPLVTITPSPAEQAAENYLADKKGWTRDQYDLENLGPGDNGQSEVIAVIHHQDKAAPHPGAGLSIQLHLDPQTHQVLRETGGQ
jgi:hypothetical protein